MAYGWEDRSQPVLENVSEASALDRVQERARLNKALEDAPAECRRISKRFNAASQKRECRYFRSTPICWNDLQLKKGCTALGAGFCGRMGSQTVIEQFAGRFASFRTAICGSGPRICVHWAAAVIPS